MAGDDLRRLFDLLIRFETEFYNAVDVRLRQDFELTLGRFETMRVIDATTGCRVQDIARALSITVGAASKVTDRVEVAGHCRRRPDPADGRSSSITLTPAGRRLLEQAGAAFDAELQARLADPLSPAALDRLRATLTTLRAAGAARSEGSTT